MTVKQELHHLVELLPDPDAAEALDYVRWLLADGDTLSDEEIEEARLGSEEIARGEYVTLDQLKRELAG